MTTTADRVHEALTWFERRGSKRNRDGMARYGIVGDKVFGVSVADTQKLAKHLGRDHGVPWPCGRRVGTKRGC